MFHLNETYSHKDFGLKTSSDTLIYQESDILSFYSNALTWRAPKKILNGNLLMNKYIQLILSKILVNAINIKGLYIEGNSIHIIRIMPLNQVGFISGMQRWLNIIIYHIRRTKKCTIMLIDIKYIFEKIQNHFMIKPPRIIVIIKDVYQ